MARTPRTSSRSASTSTERPLEQLLTQGHAFEDEGAIRFKVRRDKTTFVDQVHGPIEFDNEHIENFVILRSDGHPTYHLSVVVDDIDMAITHVVRGDDHISNTPEAGAVCIRRSARRLRRSHTCR